MKCSFPKLPHWLAALCTGVLLMAPTPAQTPPVDGLRQLVEQLEAGKPTQAREWLTVLAGQPAGTTRDLWQLWRQEGPPAALEAYREILLEIFPLAAAEQASNPLAGQEYHNRLRVLTAALELVGEHTQVDSLLNALVVPPHRLSEAPTEYAVGSQARPLQLALTHVLDRDPATLRVLERHYGGSIPHVDSILLRAAGDCSLPESADSMARWIGARETLDSTLLTQITSLLRNPAIRLTESGLQRIRPLIRHNTERTRQAAIRTLSYADDVVSIEPLIALLAHPSEATRTETLRALQRITAMTIEGHPDRWRHWFEEESTWWTTDAPTVLHRLSVADSETITQTLRTLAGKRLFRREISPKLLPLLRDTRARGHPHDPQRHRVLAPPSSPW
ncbi:MAG: HEAT repeat domain-containing protein [Planctomycetota bacterium]